MKDKGEVPTKTDFVTKQLRSVGRDPSEIEMRGYLVNVFGALKGCWIDYCLQIE